jgi:hypothetical protein
MLRGCPALEWGWVAAAAGLAAPAAAFQAAFQAALQAAFQGWALSGHSN